MRARLLIAIAVIALAGCSLEATGGTPTPAARTPTPEPSPSPDARMMRMPTPRATAEQLIAACSGKAVLLTAPYAGELHPLVVIDVDDSGNGMFDSFDAVSFAINSKFGDLATDSEWPSPIQLVVCVHHEKEKVLGSCGRFESADGTWAWPDRVQNSVTVRVVVASTGKVLQKKVLTNKVPKCPKTIYCVNSVSCDVEAPVTDEQINAYATAVSTQPVKSGSPSTPTPGPSVASGATATPADFRPWFGDPTITYRWLEDDEFDCTRNATGCWGLIVKSAHACDRISVRIETLNPDGTGTRVSYSDDSDGAVASLQPAELVFNGSHEPDPVKAMIADMYCKAP